MNDFLMPSSRGTPTPAPLPYSAPLPPPRSDNQEQPASPYAASNQQASNMPVLQCPYTASNCPILAPYALQEDTSSLPAVNIEPTDDKSAETAAARPASANNAAAAGVPIGCPGLPPSPTHSSSRNPPSVSSTTSTTTNNSQPANGDSQSAMMDPHAFATSHLVPTSICVPPSRTGSVAPPSSMSANLNGAYSYPAAPYSPVYRDPQAEGYYGRIPSPHLHGPADQPFSPQVYASNAPPRKAGSRSRSRTPDMEDLVENGHSEEPEEGSGTCTAFISKLYHLCSHDEYRDYIRWNTSGDAFVLAHANTHFATSILPRFFRHSNVSSFIRQLNLYNFTRLPTIQLLDTVDASASASPTSAFSGFSHPCFRRGDESSLRLIKPKPSKSKASRKAAAAAAVANTGKNGATNGRKVSSASRRGI